jgi:hypothetical protein
MIKKKQFGRNLTVQNLTLCQNIFHAAVLLINQQKQL